MRAIRRGRDRLRTSDRVDRTRLRPRRPPRAAPESSRASAEARDRRGGSLRRRVRRARAGLDAAAQTKGWTARGAAVYRSLKHTAARSPGAREGGRITPGAEASSFFLTNVLVVTDGATPSLARRLAALPGVKKVRAERRFPVVEPVERHAVVMEEGDAPPWGITKIGADDVWADRILGGGVVVANVDTGVDFTRRPSSTSIRATSAARSTTTTPGGTRPGSAGTSPATTRSTEHTRWARWSVATGPALTPDVGVAPGASGSPRRDARTSSAPRPRCSPPGSSSSRRRTSTV